MNIRIGQGIDVHPFSDDPNRSLVLGGIRIEDSPGLEGHSDADALIHAICDAMLGALALGDIGKHFPASDARFKNQASEMFLRHTNKLIQEQGYKLGNLDSTIVTEKPKLLPHLQAMQANIATILDCHANQVSIKATRPEKLGSLGRSEGLMAMANVLLVNS